VAATMTGHGLKDPDTHQERRLPANCGEGGPGRRGKAIGFNPPRHVSYRPKYGAPRWRIRTGFKTWPNACGLSRQRRSSWWWFGHERRDRQPDQNGQGNMPLPSERKWTCSLATGEQRPLPSPPSPPCPGRSAISLTGAQAGIVTTASTQGQDPDITPQTNSRSA